MKRFKTHTGMFYIITLRKVYVVFGVIILSLLFLYLYFILGAIFNAALSQNATHSIAILNSDSAEVETEISKISNEIITNANKEGAFVKKLAKDYIKEEVFLGRSD